MVNMLQRYKLYIVMYNVVNLEVIREATILRMLAFKDSNPQMAANQLNNENYCRAYILFN